MLRQEKLMYSPLQEWTIGTPLIVEVNGQALLCTQVITTDEGYDDKASKYRLSQAWGEASIGPLQATYEDAVTIYQGQHDGYIILQDKTGVTKQGPGITTEGYRYMRERNMHVKDFEAHAAQNTIKLSTQPAQNEAPTLALKA